MKIGTVLRGNDIVDADVPWIMNNITKFLNGKLCGATLFEIINGPCRGYIDVDKIVDVETIDDLKIERNKLIKNFTKIFKDYEIIIIDGSRKKDGAFYVSIHIIFPDLYFSSGIEVGKFVSQFIREDTYDKSVYKAAGSKQKMRLPYCGKIAPDNLEYMKILDNKKFKKFEDVTEEQYSKCCISLVPSDAVFSDVENFDFSASDGESSDEELNFIEVDQVAESEKKCEEEFPFLENFRKLMPNTEIVGRGKIEKGRQIIDLGKPADVCPFASRQHKNNRNYIVHDVKKETYTLRCFDASCVNKYKNIFKPISKPISFTPPDDEAEEDGIYKKLLKMTYDPMINGDFNDVGLAEIFSEEYADRIKIVDDDGNGYFWNGTRWHYYFSSTLQAIIPKCFEDAARKVLDKILEIISSLDPGQDKELAYHSSIKRAFQASYKRINSKSCIKNIFEIVRVETSPLFMKKNIFNSNPDLLGFENGVYNLGISVFQPYKKEDYITTSCGYDYRLPHKEEIKIWRSFLNQIMPEEDEREYLMHVLSTALYGQTIEGLFLMVGNGRNGKDTLITSILENVLGKQYYYNAQSSLLTTPMKTGACPEIANIREKRCVVITEPDKKITWKCSNIKSLTGSNSTCARGLYSSNTDTKICATFIVLCNAIPAADEMDNALGSRLKAIPFRAQFLTDDRLKEMPKDTPHIYKVDAFFKSKKFLESVKYAMLADLIEAFKNFNDAGRVIQKDPPSIKEMTKSYIENCDELYQWFQDLYEYVDDETQFIKFGEMFNEFKKSELYHNSSKIDKRRLTKKKMIENITSNPSIKGFYRDRKKIHGIDHKNIILKHRPREKDENDSKQENDSDEERTQFRRRYDE